jgi:16S rRNA (uracil1498-N3)-methyltransferase
VAELRRLFAGDLPLEGGEVVLDADAARHARVLRMTVGDPVVLFDGRGAEARGRVARIDAVGVVCRVQSPDVGAAPTAPCALVLGLPKAGKLDGIVRMVTEAGVSDVHLADTGRAVARLEGDRLTARMGRLDRVAKEAARQAGRTEVPRLHPPAPLEGVASAIPGDAVRLVAHPRASRRLVDLGVPSPSPACIAVGPEGGFTDPEVGLLEGLGFVPIRLGPHVLRVETAVVVAVALTMAHVCGR